MYILLHEYSHIMCDEKGHVDKYWNVFKNVLLLAEKLGIH